MKPLKLKVILEQHRLWVQSGRKQGKRANLQDADLACADLRDAYLQDADLACADLAGANLQDANLQGVNLAGANLQDAKLACADLQGAKLAGANLAGANLRYADLRSATFDLNFKQVAWFEKTTFSQNQIAWVCLHPKYPERADSLKWGK